MSTTGTAPRKKHARLAPRYLSPGLAWQLSACDLATVDQARVEALSGLAVPTDNRHGAKCTLNFFCAVRGPTLASVHGRPVLADSARGTSSDRSLPTDENRLGRDPGDEVEAGAHRKGANMKSAYSVIGVWVCAAWIFACTAPPSTTLNGASASPAPVRPHWGRKRRSTCVHTLR